MDVICGDLVIEACALDGCRAGVTRTGAARSSGFVRRVSLLALSLALEMGDVVQDVRGCVCRLRISDLDQRWAKVLLKSRCLHSRPRDTKRKVRSHSSKLNVRHASHTLGRRNGMRS